MFGNHTRQSLIIRPPRASVWLALAFVTSAVEAQQTTRSDAVACVKCVILHVSTTDVASLTGLPPRALEGLTIVTDVGAGALNLLDSIRAAGGTPGLVIETTATPPSPAHLQRAAVLVVTDPGPRDDAVFELRTLVTSARAIAPGVRILLDAAVIPERLAAYVDGRVERRPPHVRPTAGELIAASLEGGASQVIIH